MGEAAGLGEFIQGLFQGRIGGGLIEIPLMIGEVRDKIVPFLVLDRPETGKLIQTVFHFLTEFLVLFGAASETNDGVVLGQDAFVLQAKEGRDELAAGEVATRTENHHNKGR